MPQAPTEYGRSTKSSGTGNARTTVQSTRYKEGLERRTLYSLVQVLCFFVLCFLCSVFCTLLFALCFLYSVFCALFFALCFVVFCTLFFVLFLCTLFFFPYPSGGGEGMVATTRVEAARAEAERLAAEGGDGEGGDIDGGQRWC